MVITLYRNNSDNRKLDKSLSKIKDVKCHLKYDTSVYNPIFIIAEKNIDGVFSSVNYVLSNDFGRYYYIDKIEMLTGHEVAVQCHCDVLMSFKNYIRNSKAMINRQEFNSTPYMVDDKIPIIKVARLPSITFPPVLYRLETSLMVIIVLL